MLFDLATGNSAVVDKPLEGDWGLDGRFSPDGRRLAAVLTSADVSRLVLVDAHTAAVVTADGTFENFAYPPVWTQDGRWLVFDAPFDKSLFACDVDADLPALLPFLRRRGRVAPLVDVTGYAG